MIVSAYQPYFAPFSGFFSKAMHSHIMVLMDEVQFPRGATWLTRNRFKNDQGILWLTVPVWRKGLGLQKISEIRICHERQWAKKGLASLRSAYAKAPFYEEHDVFLEQVFLKTHEKLIDLNVHIIRYLLECLKIPVKVLLLSELGIQEKEPRLSVEICKALGGSHFLALNSAGKYLDQSLFEAAGLRLRFIGRRPPVYPQLWGNYIPNLSVFDLLFNCGPEAQRILRESYNLLQTLESSNP